MKSVGMILLGSVVIILHFIINIHTQWVDCSQVMLPIGFDIYQSTFDSFLHPRRDFKLNNTLYEEFFIQGIVFYPGVLVIIDKVASNLTVPHIGLDMAEIVHSPFMNFSVVSYSLQFTFLASDHIYNIFRFTTYVLPDLVLSPLLILLTIFPCDFASKAQYRHSFPHGKQTFSFKSSDISKLFAGSDVSVSGG